MYFMHNVVYMIIMVCLIIVFMFLANCIFKIVKLIKSMCTHTPIPLIDLCMNIIYYCIHIHNKQGKLLE